MKRLTDIFLILTAVSFCVSVTAIAGEGSDISGVLQQLGVDVPPGGLHDAPIRGYVEIIRNNEVLYLSRDGRYLIKGDILSMDAMRNLTEERRAAMRMQWLNRLPITERISIRASAEPKHSLTIFVDTNCPYCHALFQKRNALVAAGIQLDFIFYPRSGVEAESYRQAVAVWCSGDRVRALSEVLSGNELPERTCENPVGRHWELAKKMQLKGTPAIVAPDGSITYGMRSVADVISLSEQRQPAP